MDFLQNLVLPATTKHLMMVKLILALSMMIFIPFFGMLLGNSILRNFQFIRKKEQEADVCKVCQGYY